tara:strand:- start:442 stop:798 length:357 start_codon:yes stop_codon:yes gene_type:complete
MYSIVVGIIIFVAVLLVLIILAQNPKGGGLTSTFGGTSSNQIMGVQKTNDLLEKLTWVLAISIVLLTLLTNIFLDKDPSDNQLSSPNIDKASEQSITPDLNQENEDLNLDGLNLDSIN